MSHGVTERIEEQQEFFAEQAVDAETLGRLPVETTERVKATGVIRLLQPPEHGGYAADPTDFMEAVMALANADAAVGWVAGWWVVTTAIGGGVCAVVEGRGGVDRWVRSQ